jgi:hypothetical protein
LRAAWGANLEIKEIEAPTPELLAKLILELVKYSAAHIGQKGAEKRAKGKTQAPSLNDWPPSIRVEWWDAQKRFRRTRAYGCLYKKKCPICGEPMKAKDTKCQNKACGLD